MSKFLNNKDRQNRAEFDKLLARCVRVVEAQPNLATLRLCESVCGSLTTLLESIRLTIEDRPRKNDLVMLRDRIQELSFERANESMNRPIYNSDGPQMDEELSEDEESADDETQIFGGGLRGNDIQNANDAAEHMSDAMAYSVHACNNAGDYGTVNITDIGTEAPDFPIDVLKDGLRLAVARLRDASTRGDVSPYTLASIAGTIDTAVSEFDKEVGS
jgi:hypothetical protein